MNKKFGQILVDKGAISAEDLQKALELQKKNKARLGQILLKKGQVSEEEILEALAEQYHFTFTPRLEVKQIEKIRERVPLKFVQKFRIVPYKLDGLQLHVAVADPAQTHLLDEIQLMWLGYEVQLELAPESELLRIIHNYFEKSAPVKEGTGMELDLEFLEEMEEMPESIDLANEAPIIKMVNVILSNAVSERASDIHIEPQEKELSVRYRIDGMLHRVLSPPKSVQNGLISRIKIMAGMNIAENRLPQDGRIKVRFGGKDIDIRVSSLPSQFGERIVLRLLNKTDANFSLDSIGFDPHTLKTFRELLTNSNGIILITGPTGSGKTSTLYASLNSLNNGSKNIITVEDPIEYQFDGISQVQAKPAIGLGFAEGLRSILRQDPDIIMVGEIRDTETVRVAIQSALTGHLVFSTLHTNDAVSAVTRLLDMGIEPYLVTATLRGVMAQRLLRMLCPHCKKPVKLSPAEQKKLGLPEKKGSLTIYEPLGCEKCMHSGYYGRTGVYELLVINHDLRQKIVANASIDELNQAALKAGLVSLRQYALQKVAAGLTSLEEALRVT